MSSPDAIQRRRAIARRAAAAYIVNPAVAAVLLAGSVARGLADDLSDIELDVYWRRPPSDDERIATVEGAGWERVYAEEDEHEWADGYRIDGVKLDAGNFLTSTIDDYLTAALDCADTEPELQVRITALLHGEAQHGAPLIDAWRERLRGLPRPGWPSPWWPRGWRCGRWSGWRCWSPATTCCSCTATSSTTCKACSTRCSA